MSFRDEETALRARLAALERVARDAENLTEQNRQLTEENARLKQRVAELTARLEPPRPVEPRPPTESKSNELTLSFRWHDDAGAHHKTLQQPFIKIGKLSSSHLRIAAESVSRMHAVIEISEGTAEIGDLGSSRGTRVNGKKTKKATIQDGDQLQVGDILITVGIGS